MAQNPFPSVPSPLVHEHHIHLPAVLAKVVFVVLLIFSLVIGSCATLLYQNLKGPKEHLTVKGKGTVYLVPSGASVDVDVIQSSLNEQTAVSANAQTLAKIKQAILALGVPQGDITNTAHNVTPPLTCIGTCPTPPSAQDAEYSVDDKITIMFDEKTVKLAEKVVSAAEQYAYVAITTPGANSQKGDIKYLYRVNDLNTLIGEARLAALQDARDQAQKLLSINDRRLGKFVSLKDTTDANLLPTVSQDGSVELPVASGAQPDLSTQVTIFYDVTYEID